MKCASLTKELEYNDSRPVVKILMDTDSSREIRITMKQGQVMKEHKTPYPIIVEIFEGHITIGAKGENHNLVRGDLVYLEGGVPHDLRAEQDSTVRLTLSKSDTAERVKGVVDSSS